MTLAILYQFPISHYCEKARWSLDYKSLDYSIKNLLPGLHGRTLRKIAADTTLPVLYFNGSYTQGSPNIIDLLDAHIAENPLTPVNQSEQLAAHEWEQYAAEHIGDPVRDISYFYLLDYPEVVKSRFSQDGPWYSKLYLYFAYASIAKAMRKAYRLNEKTLQHAKQKIATAIARIEHTLQQQPYLVGQQFTRADLSVCALLSPLVFPSVAASGRAYFSPEPLRTFREQYANGEVFEWVRRIYREHRH